MYHIPLLLKQGKYPTQPLSNKKFKKEKWQDKNATKMFDYAAIADSLDPIARNGCKAAHLCAFMYITSTDVKQHIL